MTYGVYQSTADAVKTFVQENLIAAALVLDPPETLNIFQQFTNFLVAGRFNKLRAEEEAEKQSGLVRYWLDQALDQWIEIGLPAPIGYANNPDVVLTRKHARYREITGYEPLSSSFIETHEWLAGLGPREFLMPCVAFLKIIGCDPIFVTDGPRDRGIDCIGKIAGGPMRSTIVFVQSKTSSTRQWLSPQVIYQEYGKYAMLPRTDKYREYLRALNVEKNCDGSTSVYVVISNGEFGRQTQVVARELGILLRSVRQLAYFLAIYSTPKQLKEMESQIPMPSRPDLTTNMASRIRLAER